MRHFTYALLFGFFCVPALDASRGALLAGKQTAKHKIKQRYMQDGANAKDASNRTSLTENEPLVIGLFWRENKTAEHKIK